jgi:hypothetical protein
VLESSDLKLEDGAAPRGLVTDRVKALADERGKISDRGEVDVDGTDIDLEGVISDNGNV